VTPTPIRGEAQYAILAQGSIELSWVPRPGWQGQSFHWFESLPNPVFARAVEGGGAGGGSNLTQPDTRFGVQCAEGWKDSAVAHTHRDLPPAWNGPCPCAAPSTVK